jgi:hypothetical protein
MQVDYSAQGCTQELKKPRKKEIYWTLFNKHSSVHSQYNSKAVQQDCVMQEQKHSEILGRQTISQIRHTVKPLIEGPGRLFFDPKILEIFTLVPPYMILLKGGRPLEGAFK